MAREWNWHVAGFMGFGDFSLGIWDVSPAVVEAYGEAFEIEVIGTWGYTVVAEYPFSFESRRLDGGKTGWFGDYWDRNFPWVYHREHGWVHVFGLDPHSIWLWEAGLGFTWTAAGVYPWFWSASHLGWFYYSRGSSSPRMYYSAMDQA